jgi:hypothetical protein
VPPASCGRIFFHKTSTSTETQTMHNDDLNQPPTPSSQPSLPEPVLSKTRSEPTGRPYATTELSLGDDPLDRAPIGGALSVIEAVLRHPRRVVFQLNQGGDTGRLIGLLLVVALGFVAVYGAIVGSYSGGEQWWAAPLKITVGLAETAGICLPSLYIFACLSGSRARLSEVAGALAGALALATLLLIGFAPVAWLFSQSTSSVAFMGALHLVFWLVATVFGVNFLGTAFRHFGLRSESGLKVWAFIFLLVSLQMTTALRPLVGPFDQKLLPLAGEKKFFLAHWLDSMATDAKRAPARGTDVGREN